MSFSDVPGMSEAVEVARESASKLQAEQRKKGAESLQALVDKFYADRSISGKELLDILHGFGLIPKPVPTPKPAPAKK